MACVLAKLSLRTGVVLAQDCNSNSIPDACDIACGAPGGPCEIASEDTLANGRDIQGFVAALLGS